MTTTTGGARQKPSDGAIVGDGVEAGILSFRGERRYTAAVTDGDAANCLTGHRARTTGMVHRLLTPLIPWTVPAAADSSILILARALSGAATVISNDEPDR